MLQKKKLIEFYISLIVLFFGIGISSCSEDSTGTPSSNIGSIEILSSYDDIVENDEIELTAKVYDEDGRNLYKSVNWTVSGSGQVSPRLADKTKLTARNSGIVEVTAELEGVSTTRSFEISADDNMEFSYLYPSKLDNAKITFTWLVLIYEVIDIPANTTRGHGRIKYSMTQTEVNELLQFIDGFEEFTAQYTGGEIGFNFAVVTLDDRRPLSDLYWDGNRYQWTESNDLTREMDKYIGHQSGWFDNIHVFFKMDGSHRPSAMYGGLYMRDNITFSQYTLMGYSKNDWHVGTWHESIHGLETQYWLDSFRNGSCKRGIAPDGTDIELHGQPSFGYMGNDDEGGPKSQNYFQWMADLTTGNIRNLLSVGWENYDSAQNTNLGFGKNGMYEWGPVRYEYEFKEGGPFPQE